MAEERPGDTPGHPRLVRHLHGLLHAHRWVCWRRMRPAVASPSSCVISANCAPCAASRQSACALVPPPQVSDEGFLLNKVHMEPASTIAVRRGVIDHSFTLGLFLSSQGLGPLCMPKTPASISADSKE